MDASKLLNILLDLTSIRESSITDTLSLLLSNISSNQSTEITANLQKLKKEFEESITNKYSPSNLKIVQTIGADIYFGLTGYEKLAEVISKNAFNVPKTIADLQYYIKKRTDYVTLVDQMCDDLRELNIEPHFHDDTIFEVGLLMPEELTENKIINITKELNHWDKVFKTLKELTTGSVDDTEINFVNNGSLEFFINNAPDIAVCLAVAVERIIKLYNKILEIRSAKERLKELGVSTGEQRSIEKQEKEILKKEIDSIASDLVKDYAHKQIDSGRVNELKIAMNGHVAYIVKCIGSGMIIEINPPEISEPKEVSETDTDEKKSEVKKLKYSYDKTIKQIELVQKSMDAINAIGKTGIDIVKYLTDGEEAKEE